MNIKQIKILTSTQGTKHMNKFRVKKLFCIYNKSCNLLSKGIEFYDIM